MKTTDLQAGDIILVHGSSWLAKAIQFFMNVYRKKKGLPKRFLYNHVAVVIDIWGELKIAEAERKGIEAYRDAYQYVDEHNVKVMTWKKPLSDSEKKQFSKLAAHYSFKATKYDFFNFFYQMYYIMTGKWVGKKGKKSENVLYCSEFAAVLMDKVRGSFGGIGRTESINPLDIELNNHLIEKQ